MCVTRGQSCYATTLFPHLTANITLERYQVMYTTSIKRTSIINFFNP